ncbi:unnamed protein product, partial [Dicrocoelium dendriticum]
MSVSQCTEAVVPDGSDSEVIALCGGPSCNIPVTDDSGGMQCDVCNRWYHQLCTELNTEQYAALASSEKLLFSCANCCSRRQGRTAFRTRDESLDTRLRNVERSFSMLSDLRFKIDLLMTTLPVSNKADLIAYTDDQLVAPIIMSPVQMATDHQNEAASDVVSKPTLIDAELLVQGSLRVKRRRARKPRKLSAKQEVVVSAPETSQVSLLGKPSDGCAKAKIPTRTTCQPKLPEILVLTEKTYSEGLLDSAQSEKASRDPAPVIKKKKQTKSAIKPSGEIDDPNKSKTST